MHNEWCQSGFTSFIVHLFGAGYSRRIGDAYFLTSFRHLELNETRWLKPLSLPSFPRGARKLNPARRWLEMIFIHRKNVASSEGQDQRVWLPAGPVPSSILRGAKSPWKMMVARWVCSNLITRAPDVNKGQAGC